MTFNFYLPTFFKYTSNKFSISFKYYFFIHCLSFLQSSFILFLTLHLNIISLLLFIFFISHSPSVSLSHYLSIFLNPVRLLPPSDICSQNFRGLSFSSSSLINHGHSHNHGHHHHQPQPQPPTTKKKKNKKKNPRHKPRSFSLSLIFALKTSMV